MGRYNLSPTAKRDLITIRRYISRDGRERADRVIDELRAKMQHLADHPEQGHRREDLTDRPLRFWPVYSFFIVYRPDTSPLEIIAVPSGYEDVEELLKP
jgi:antitoxin ParD1/3/4/toxin ParE1/3/4